ncbi:MAG: ABC transporter permease [Betaproteobacteria bacterium]|nr:ABC transporter permease [Betaproteobacteria bacterium]
MGEAAAALEIAAGGAGDGPPRVRVHGEWTFRGLAAAKAALARQLSEIERHPARELQWDLSGITALDDAGAVWLARALREARSIEVPERHQEILRQASEGLLVPREARKGFDPLWAVVALGAAGINLAVHLRDGVNMLGQLAIDVFHVARQPRETPLLELSAGVFRAGVTALPVTMLVGFLVGIVLTYLSALQLARYGADLLVINIVGVGVVRELGPMLASIIAAGRSGSAITAQLGVMRVTEEIEALSVMGISITSRLVLPKVIALAIALPLVAFCTDLAALVGAMLVAKFTLGIAPAAFMEALPRAVEVVNFWIGIGKSVAFGFAVAFVACHYGLRVLPNTDSLAVGVTRSVVSSITCVILLDAIFAILLRNVG